MLEKLYTPIIIGLIHIFGLIMLTIYFFVELFRGYGFFRRNIFAIFIGFVISIIVWRIICEGIILQYKMLEELQKIAKNHKKK